MKTNLIKLSALLLAALFLAGCSTVSKTTEAPDPLKSSEIVETTPTTSTTVSEPTFSPSNSTDENTVGIIEIDGKKYLKAGLKWNQGDLHFNPIGDPVGGFESVEHLQTWLNNYNSKTTGAQQACLESVMYQREETTFLLPDFEKLTRPNHLVFEDYSIEWDPAISVNYIYPDGGELCIYYADPSLDGKFQLNEQGTIVAYKIAGSYVPLEDFMNLTSYPSGASETTLFGRPAITFEPEEGYHRYFQSYQVDGQNYYLLINNYSGGDIYAWWFTQCNGYLYRYSYTDNKQEYTEIPQFDFLYGLTLETFDDGQ